MVHNSPWPNMLIGGLYFSVLWQFSVLDNVYAMWSQFTFTHGFPTMLYPILRMVLPPVILHLALVLGGIWLFFRTFTVSNTAWWYVLIFPYVGITSMQFTSALPPFLVLAAIYAIRRRA